MAKNLDNQQQTDEVQAAEQAGSIQEVIIPVVSVGNKFCYNVPSFPAISTMMRHMKYEYTETDGSVSLLDGFIRECPLLDRTYPAFAAIENECPNGFIIEVYIHHCV